MMLHRYCEYPGLKLSPTFLDRKTYAKALDGLIIVCADVLFTLKGTQQALLPTRVREPGKGLWMIGGRLNRGESPEEAIRRHTLADCGLDLPASRFRFVQINEYLFQHREQPPTENGSHTIGFTFRAEITPKERVHASAHLRPTEYDPALGLAAYEKRELQRAHAPKAIVDLYRHIFSAERSY